MNSIIKYLLGFVSIICILSFVLIKSSETDKPIIFNKSEQKDNFSENRPTKNNPLKVSKKKQPESSSTVDYAGIISMGTSYREPRLPKGNSLNICSGHGCQHISKVKLNDEIIDSVKKYFVNINNSEDERIAIKKAIPDFEKYVGPKTGTDGDIASLGVLGSSDPTQLDCVDEAFNTTFYLIMLRERNLIKFHNILTPTWRGGLFQWTHYVAVIENSGTKWIIDSGVSDNGGPVKIMKYEDWK